MITIMYPIGSEYYFREERNDMVYIIGGVVLVAVIVAVVASVGGTVARGIRGSRVVGFFVA